jgi:CRP-like cAMP-binding protein
LQGNTYEAGEIFSTPGDAATSLFLLQEGVIDVYTSFEKYEFSLVKLFKGSILNYRTFFMFDQ